MPCGTRLVQRQETRHRRAVPDIALHKDMPRLRGETGEVFKIAGVGQLVEIDDGLAVRGQPVQDEIGADKTSASSDQNHSEIFRDV
jgi:hypothetical protein